MIDEVIKYSLIIFILLGVIIAWVAKSYLFSRHNIAFRTV